MNPISKTAAALGVQYEVYRIYIQDSVPAPRSHCMNVAFRRIGGAELSLATDPQIRALESYNRPTEAFGFGAFIDDQIRSACWYWAGKTYTQRGFWHLEAKDAKLVQIVTADTYKGRGLATALIEWSSAEMAREGYTRRCARIWHSHRSSIRAFEKAGWRSHAFVATLDLAFPRATLRVDKIIGRRLSITLKKP